MNKVFKVIWSEARNAYVVVSEMAKSHGTKSCSTKKLLAMLIATGIMTCASVAPVMAANLAPEDYQIEAGNGASASGQGSVAIGNNAQASGLVGIAIGRDAVASGTDSIAIGSSTKADQTYSVAIGNDIGFTAYAGTAVGQQAYASGDNATAIGTMTNIDAKYNASHDDWRKAGAQSTAIGAYAGSWGLASTAVGGFSKAKGKLATAIGYNSWANVDYGTALGDYSEVTAGWGVAIGASSVADRESGVIGAFAPEGADSLTWRANGGAVSVGSATLTRQITNVAAGTEATDAVNVAQLQEATQNTGWHLSAEKEITKDINSTTKIQHGDIVHFQGTDDNITISKEETEDTTVMHVALSRNLAIDSVQAGDFFMNNEKGIGFGGEAYITQNGLNANDKVITNVAAGTADTDAVNVGQLNKVSLEAGKHSVVTEGANITVTPEQAEDGRMQYNVALNNDIILSGDNDAFVNISGSNGSVWASGSVAAGNVIMDGTTATVSGLGNTTTAYDGFANGEGKAATEEQLKEISKVAENANQGWNLSTNGGEASKVAPGETVDFSGDKNINISNDGTNVKVKLNENIDVNSVQTNALNSKYNLSVGTMAENGIMPFFVNSTGDFYAAHNKFHVDKDGKVTATAGEIGNVVLNNGVFTGHSALRDGELFVGDASGNYSQITTKGAKLGQVVIAEDGKISNVAAGVADTDAVNVGQLKEAVEAGNTDTHIKPGEYGVGADNTVKMDVVDKNGNKVDTVTIKDVAKASDVGDVNNIADDIKNGEGHTTVVDAVNNLNNKVGDLQYSKVEKGEIADGDSTTTAIGKLDQKLTDVAATAAKHSKVVDGNNINVEETDVDGQKFYKVNMNKNIILGDLTDKYVNISGTNGTIETTGYIATQDRVYADKGGKLADIDVTGNKISNGASSIVLDGSNVKVNDKVTIDQDGKISGVAAGEVSSTSTDAINGSQLHQAKADINNRIDGVENQVINNTNRINKLGSRVNKVGAGAAALAALHPMDFDPDDKLTFSAGYGNYAGENAAAIGAYYRPDEKVMFSVAGTVGNGENMVNAGVSFALDRTNHVSNSRTALAREVIDLRGQLAVMGAKMAKMEKAFGMLDETKTKLFPDVPANHWAYEYIAKLAGNGYIEGYPDGNFGGDRLMTRYEFAAMLYRAIENGAALEEKIIKEFEPELGRIRVDRISGEDGDCDKIERVRVNDTKGERDHYGNKLAK
ncbi:ESPR-type extended signal peptide-containing protein [Phascolarctobacterium succinatutens]|uniref:ESPR-type extended signal peptide-containing protein n=1 Tax=Phascolarctobacterium succinatutens TaxID=626940 RepID=UPI0026F12BF4|nr:ESPR-type extended signal peptide-containing protein [Phascolarctobacterium succinatutens]